MSRIRDIANILSGNTSMATDAEVTSSIASHAAAADPHTVYLKESEFNAGGKNSIINGGIDFWQRGTSIAFGNNYTADRWHGYHSSGVATASRSTDKPSGFQYSLKVQRNVSATATDPIYLSYMMESLDSYKYQGQVVTVSFYAKAGANYSPTSSILQMSLRTTTSVDGNVISGPWVNTSYIINQSSTLTTSWQRFSYTGTIGSTANSIAIVFASFHTGTAGADDAYYITGVQLELGSSATLFSRSSGTIQGELAACQRYYWRSTPGSVYSTHANGMATSSTTSYSHMHFPVPMRISPTSVDYANVGFGDLNAGVINPSFVGLTSYTGTYGIVVQVNATGYTQYRPGQIMNNNNVAGYLGFSAEL